MNEGRFRADLYHRLSVYPISVPALRHRDGDVTLLAGYFLEQARRKLGIVQIKLNKEAQYLLSRYNWPGNVRELEHVINRAALKARARANNAKLISVSIEDIGDLHAMPIEASAVQTSQLFDMSESLVSKGLRESTEDFQRQLILMLLRRPNLIGLKQLDNSKQTEPT